MILIQKENEGKTVKDIKSYEFYGDNPEIFHSLVGFEIADILFTHTKLHFQIRKHQTSQTTT